MLPQNHLPRQATPALSRILTPPVSASGCWGPDTRHPTKQRTVTPPFDLTGLLSKQAESLSSPWGGGALGALGAHLGTHETVLSCAL